MVPISEPALNQGNFWNCDDANHKDKGSRVYGASNPADYYDKIVK